MVMPTVQPSWRAWATMWSVVCLAFGRRIFGIASISSTVSKSFMPIGIERRRRYWLRPFTIASQSYLSVVVMASSASFPSPLWGEGRVRGSSGQFQRLSQLIEMIVVVAGEARHPLAQAHAPARLMDRVLALVLPVLGPAIRIERVADLPADPPRREGYHLPGRPPP